MRYSSRTILCFALAAAFTAASLLAGCNILPEEEQVLAPPLVKPKRTEYELYEVVKKNITMSLQGTGNLIASKEDSLYFEQSGGRLKSIDVKLGQAVKKGQVVARLDTGSIESKIKQQKNSIAKAEIQLKSQKNLLDKYLSMPDGLKPAPVEIEELKKNSTLQELDLDSARIELQDLERQYGQATLNAPFDGIVTFIEDLKAGDSVEAYKRILTVSDPQELQVYYQPSGKVDDVKVGMKATIRYENKEYNGEVVLSPDNAPEDALDKFKNALVIKVQDIPEELEWGDAVDFSIDIKTKENVLIIPKKGLRRIVGRSFVQVMDGDSKKEYDVRTGIESDYEVEIISGLKEGNKVIIN